MPRPGGPYLNVVNVLAVLDPDIFERDLEGPRVARSEERRARTCLRPTHVPSPLFCAAPSRPSNGDFGYGSVARYAL